MEDLASMCDEVSAKWLEVWTLGREAQDKPGGPSWKEVDHAMNQGFAWHDAAESLRMRKG